MHCNIALMLSMELRILAVQQTPLIIATDIRSSRIHVVATEVKAQNLL